MPNCERGTERRGRSAGLVLLGLISPAWEAAQAQFAPHGAPFQVNTYATGRQGRPDLAVGPTGELLVVWLSEGGTGNDSDGWSIQGQRLGALGAPLGGEFQVNSYTTGFQTGPAVAALAPGGFVVAWESGGSGGSDTDGPSIQARRFDANGVPLGADFQVNSVTTGLQLRPAVAGVVGGGFVVVWDSRQYLLTGTEDRLRGRRFAADGTPLGDEFAVPSVANEGQAGPAIAAGQGGFVVAWSSRTSTGDDQSGGSVQARRFDTDGMPLGPDFQVNTFTTDFQGIAAVAMTPAGEFVVAWTSAVGQSPFEVSLRAQRFEAGGGAVGGEILVTPPATYPYVTGRDLAVDPRGGFVVVWDDYAEVRARGFRPDGTPLAGQFQVNTYTFDYQVFPRLAADRDGNLAFAWSSRGSDGTDQDLDSVQARLYDALFRDGVETGDASRWSAVAP